MALGTPYQVGASSQATGLSATLAIPVSTATTTGDCLVVAAGNSNTVVTGITDSKGNTYTSAAAQATGQKCSVWVALNTNALTTSDTISVTFNTSTGNQEAIVLGCSGVATASALDQAPTPTTGTSTSPSITSGTLAQAAELCVAVFQDGSGGGAPSAFGAFTNLSTQHITSSVWLSMAYDVVNATTAVTASCTIVSTTWTALLITLKASSGPVVGSVTHSVAGAPTSSGFTVVSKTQGATSVRLKVATDQALTQNVQFVAAQSPDSMGYVRHTPAGLTAHTQYYYQLADTPSGGSETLIGPVNGLKTLPPAGSPQSFTVALGACITQAAADSSAMDSWTAYNADLNIFTGDLDYSGTTSTTLATQVGVYETQIASAAGLKAMVGNAFGYYCRSDHEAGPDNGDSNQPYVVTNIAAAQQVFPFGTLGDTVNTPVRGLYQSWVVGRVRFIMLDIRNLDRSPGANTDDASKTMLGATQLAWLKNELIQSEPLKVIISDVQWMGDPTAFLITNGPDKWFSYTTERQAILDYISANSTQVQNLMLWHGDTHAVGVATAAQNTWGGFPVYCAAPLHNTGGGLDLATFSSYYNNSGGNCRQYGRISITDDGTHITVVYSGWDATAAVARVTQTDTFYAPSGKGRVWDATSGTWKTFTPKVYDSGTSTWVAAKTKVWDASTGTWKTTNP